MPNHGLIRYNLGKSLLHISNIHPYLLLHYIIFSCTLHARHGIHTKTISIQIETVFINLIVIISHDSYE